MDKKLEEAWVKDVEETLKKEHSSLAVPMLGEIQTPLCKICIHSDFHYGSWDEPECFAFSNPDNAIPDEYLHCRKYDCPKFERNKKSNFDDFFDENHQPIK